MKNAILLTILLMLTAPLTGCLEQIETIVADETGECLVLEPGRASDGKLRILTYDIAAFSEQDFAALKQEIMAFWPEVATSVDLHGQQDFIAANYHDIWTSKPYTNRLVLIGDIEHATSPQ